MIDKAQIENFLRRIQDAEESLSDPAVMGNASLYRKKVREHASLKKLERVAHDYFNLLAQLEDNSAMVDDPSVDPELAEMARDEIETLREKIPALEKAFAPTRT